MEDDQAGRGPIRIGLVGVGKIACDQHVPALVADPRFALTATASLVGEIAGVPAYRDIAAMLSGAQCFDAVSICTPPSGRLEIAQAAIAAGLAVMVEKPPAATLGEAEALVAAARAANVPLFTTWHSREAAALAEARIWLSDKTVTAARVTWAEDIRRWHPGQDWILGEGGFGVFDPDINALSIISALMPGPWSVERATLAIPENRASPVAATMALRARGVPVAVELDFLQMGPQRWNIGIETNAGSLELSDGGAAISFDGAPPRSAPNREYSRLYAHFAKLIASGESDVDLVPLEIVAQAFALASRKTVAPFFF